MKKILTCLLAALGLTSACGQDNFENTDVQGFTELVADSNVVVLDVRTVAEFTEGHIERAILIDQDKAISWRKQRPHSPSTRRLPSIVEVAVGQPMQLGNWQTLAISV